MLRREYCHSFHGYSFLSCIGMNSFMFSRQAHEYCPFLAMAVQLVAPWALSHPTYPLLAQGIKARTNGRTYSVTKRRWGAASRWPCFFDFHLQRYAQKVYYNTHASFDWLDVVVPPPKAILGQDRKLSQFSVGRLLALTGMLAVCQLRFF